MRVEPSPPGSSCASGARISQTTPSGANTATLADVELPVARLVARVQRLAHLKPLVLDDLALGSLRRFPVLRHQWAPARSLLCLTRWSGGSLAGYAVLPGRSFRSQLV